jgi:hypothetical protein
MLVTLFGFPVFGHFPGALPPIAAAAANFTIYRETRR